MRIYYRIYEDPIYPEPQIEAKTEPFDDGGHTGHVTDVPDIEFIKLSDDKKSVIFDVEAHDKYMKERPLDMLRAERNLKLSETDWVVTKYAERGQATPAEWVQYRQALRDITKQQVTFHRELNSISGVNWPTKPTSA